MQAKLFLLHPRVSGRGRIRTQFGFMGFRFRKSMKIAPGVHLNFNKGSTSVTFGGKGAKYTVSSSGKKTASVGLPGTGISYSETVGDQDMSAAKKKKKGGWGWGVMLAVMVAFCFMVPSEDSEPEETVDPVGEEQIAEQPAEQPVETPVEQPEDPPAEETPAETVVYITDTGRKYHRGSCKHLSESKIEISLSNAVKQYDPCGTCKPPTN